MVPLGEWSVPLLGIPASAVEEQCDECKESQHLTKVAIVGSSRFLCSICLLNLLVVKWTKAPNRNVSHS